MMAMAQQQQQQQQQQQSGSGSDMSASNCYSECLTSKKVTIPFVEVGSHAAKGTITQMIRNYISTQVENKCTVEGFVHPNTCKILSHSSGLLQGPNVVFDVAYSCSVFLPCEGAILVCRVKSVTSAGILAGINGTSVVNPVIVYILREHHASDSDKYFNSIRSDAVVRVKVIGHRFELNDKHVSVIGELIQPDASDLNPEPNVGASASEKKGQMQEGKEGKKEKGKEPESGLYFEHQNMMASCGRHALNNLLQRRVFTFDHDDGVPMLNLTAPPPKGPINLHQLCLTMNKKLQKSHSSPVRDEFECLSYENHSISLLMAALSLVNHSMENPSNDKDTVSATLLSLGAASEWKMLVNENGSPRGGHWTAVIKNGDDPAVYYLNSLKNKVVTYSTIQDFVDRFIQQEFSSSIQFAFVERIANYVNPIRRYDEHLQ
jgi:DNA-directed RNA polymerase subunit E'/Rpb7